MYENCIFKITLSRAVLNLNVKNKFFRLKLYLSKNMKKPEKDLSLNNLEKTNIHYAVAKISGLKLCDDFYGINLKQFAKIYNNYST